MMPIPSITSKNGFPISEAELMLRLRDHDVAAFEQVYDNYAHTLYNIILKITPDKLLAGNVLQNVFIRLWSDIGNYDNNNGQLFTWMSHMAKYLTMEVLKAKQSTQAGIAFKVCDDANDCLFLCTNMDIIAIRQQLIKLSPKFQLVMELAYFYDFTSEQISTVLKQSLDTVTITTKLALQQLRRLQANASLN